MFYKVYADGTLMDIVYADSRCEAVEIVKMKTPNTSFVGIHWTVGVY